MKTAQTNLHEAIALPVARRTEELFEERRQEVARETDKLFAGLMVAQYAAGITAALLISPRAWAGTSSSIHANVWAAVVLGGLIASLPIAFALFRPATVLTRHVVAVGQMLMGSLLIHLSGGRIETHFHIFGSLAFLSFYRDWRVLVTASLVVAADHLLRGLYWPRSIFGILAAGPWLWVEHVGWVVFEDVFLIGSCLRGVRGMRGGAEQRARLEATQERVEQTIAARTAELATAQSRLAASAAFSAALNQADALSTYRAALQCLARMLQAPVAVVYASSNEGLPTARFAYTLDDLLPKTELFCGSGLPATVVRTAEVQELTGPFRGAGLRLRVGLGELDLGCVIGWPISFNGRCLGALITAHVSPPNDEQRAFVCASLEQLAVRMSAFAIEDQRLRLLADVHEKSRALEEARRDAERASRVKSEFLANMSHELRTPMNSIMGFTARLIRKLGDTVGERERDALHTVDRNAKHLLNLINDILDLSKIEAGQMEVEREPIDISAVIREAISVVTPLLDGKPISLRAELPNGPLMLNADGMKLKQVAMNLISNAIKYTDAGSVVVSATEGEDAKLGHVLRISVRDTGVGIAIEDQPKLFQQFTQLNGGSTRRVGGTGLGLVITAQYVRLHGGRIDVASAHGRGSVFTVVLPLDEERFPPSSTHGSAPRRDAVARSMRPGVPKTLTILCIDDEPDVLRHLQLTFEEAGYEVLLAHDFDEATAGARQQHPDLICLDLGLSGRDGFDVLRALRQEPVLAGIPVVVVSEGDQAAQAIAAGARCCIAKPIDADDLLMTVRAVLAGDSVSALIVEDDPDTRRLIATALAEHGIDVRTAANGREAVSHLVEAVPSVILLDIMMPVMNGFELLEHLQRDPVWSRIPVIILTAKVLVPEETAQLAGLSDVILIKGRGDTERVVEAILQAVGVVKRKVMRVLS
ncbi:MAG: response regulator [Isosphaeraceae bacterium]|nr:response regulator [Isosphaeraceae bacterium]